MAPNIAGPPFLRRPVLNGDCTLLMTGMEANSVDFILTDPPYITRYRGRDGRTVANDDNARWLKPAFAEAHRVLKPGGFAVSFYGWNKVDLFFEAWKAAGFRIVGHLVFRKRYASSAAFLRYADRGFSVLWRSGLSDHGHGADFRFSLGNGQYLHILDHVAGTDGIAVAIMPVDPEGFDRFEGVRRFLAALPCNSAAGSKVKRIWGLAYQGQEAHQQHHNQPNNGDDGLND